MTLFPAASLAVGGRHRWPVFAAVLAVLSPAAVRRHAPASRPTPSKADADQAATGRCSAAPSQRNLVNLVEKNIPPTGASRTGTEKNIKWSADLGSKAYGGPIICRRQDLHRHQQPACRATRRSRATRAS